MNDHHTSKCCTSSLQSEKSYQLAGDSSEVFRGTLSQFANLHGVKLNYLDGESLLEPCVVCGGFHSRNACEGLTPVSNTGVKSTLIDVNDANSAARPSVSIDTLTISFPGLRFDGSVKAVSKWLRKWSAGLLEVGGELQKHYNGYYKCFDIVLSDGTKSPMLGWLGVSNQGDQMRGRWCLHLTGQGCACLSLVSHKQPGWCAVHYEVLVDRDGRKERAVSRKIEGATVSAWEMIAEDAEAYDLKVTRVDLAADDLEGKHSIDVARAMYDAKAFNSNGSPPKYRLILNSGGDGDTFYVGRACSGKMLRVYEKGKQLGCPDSKWVRWEVQMSAINRRIPVGVLTDPRAYLVGAYPAALKWVGSAATMIATKVERARIALQHAIKYAKQQAGSLIRYLKDGKGFDSAAIVDELIAGPGRYPLRLFDYQLPDDPWTVSKKTN